jgi:hypothetical protein
MTKALILCCALFASFAADDPWDKVRELKSGTELRIIKKGSVQPILARMDEATAESLLVVVKTEQISLPRDQIVRIDYRPVKPSGLIKEPQSAVVTDNRATGGGYQTGQTSSISSGINVAGKQQEFKTIYRRPPDKTPK